MTNASYPSFSWFGPLIDQEEEALLVTVNIYSSLGFRSWDSLSVSVCLKSMWNEFYRLTSPSSKGRHTCSLNKDWRNNWFTIGQDWGLTPRLGVFWPLVITNASKMKTKPTFTPSTVLSRENVPSAIMYTHINTTNKYRRISVYLRNNKICAFA